MNSDPVLLQVAAATLAIVFVVGAVHKLRDLDAFAEALAAYALLPAPLLRPLATGLPLLELAAGVALALAPALGALLACVVLAVVTTAVVVNLLRGHRDVGCGCGGFEDEQPLSWTLVARNALLGLLAMAIAHGAAPRALLWLDYLTVGAGTLAAYGLYLLANQLIANQPRLARLRRVRA